MSSIIAQSSQGNKPPSTITLKKAVKSGIKNRPKSPSLQKITCTYDGKDIELDFVLSEGIAELRICDENLNGGRYELDTSSQCICIRVGDLSGEIHIELETEFDNIYAGDMYY